MDTLQNFESILYFVTLVWGGGSVQRFRARDVSKKAKLRVLKMLLIMVNGVIAVMFFFKDADHYGIYNTFCFYERSIPQ